jgi:hypothetical protein
MQDYLLVGESYKKYPSSCHIPTAPFLNIGDVVKIQSKIKYGVLPVQDHLLVGAFYKKYPSPCHI